jgi:hypothetical protein
MACLDCIEAGLGNTSQGLICLSPQTMDSSLFGTFELSGNSSHNTWVVFRVAETGTRIGMGKVEIYFCRLLDRFYSTESRKKIKIFSEYLFH